jgi:tRNA(Phe) wybutosine-synthesizing methylase Tyw3
MTFVDITPGQWVLAFHQPYGPHDDRTLSELLESYAFLHWMDNRDKDEVFFVRQVQAVKPKTFMVHVSCRYLSEGERLPRSLVIAGCKSKADALALRDRLFAIGVDTGEKIEAEMYRRVEKFSQREQAKALKKIHRLLPQHFGGSA